MPARLAASSTSASSTAYDHLRRFAESDGAVVCAFLWAFAEATLQPLIPDLLLGVLAPGTRRKLPRLLGAALAGMLVGGCCTLAVAEMWPGTAHTIVVHLPLVHATGLAEAARTISSQGIAAAFLYQPWSGIPFKVWAVAAGMQRADPLAVLVWFAVGRTLRIVAVTLTVAGLASLLERVAPMRRWFLPLLITGLVCFTAGFVRVVVA